jgi:hypothetical protein
MFITDPNFSHPGSKVKKFPGSASASTNLSILTQKIVSKLSGIMIQVHHPGFGSWFFAHLGSRGQKGTGSRIRNFGCQNYFYIDPARVRPRGARHHLGGGFPHQERSCFKGGPFSHACKNSLLSDPDPDPVGIQIRFQEGTVASQKLKKNTVDFYFTKCWWFSLELESRSWSTEKR